MDLGADFTDGVLVRKAVDNGDGTWTTTDYRTDPPTVTTEDGKPLPEPAQHAPTPPTDAEIEAARLSLAAATTVAQTKTRALALDDLRARQLAAIPT